MQNGVTLIALVITIIILLILAGVSISLVLGNNGILNRAEESVKITKIKEAEEFARMSYAGRQIDEIVEEKATIIAGVVSDLKEEGYTIKQETGDGNNIIGITLSEENVILERNTTKTITYTFVYADEMIVRYFVEVQGKYYEINFDNGNITISTEEITLGETTEEPEVIIESSDSSIIEVTETEERRILLTAKDTIGDIEITVKEVNSGVAKKFTATTRIPVTSINLIPTEKTICIGKTANLTATVEPSNAINQTVSWSSSEPSVATVSDSGVVTAVAIGTAKITASADGITSNVCTITTKELTLSDEVKENPNVYYGTKVNGYTVNGISDWRIFYADDENVFIITTDYVENSKLPVNDCGMKTVGTYRAYWESAPSVANTANVDKFNPVTAETMKWEGDYDSYYCGRCVSTLLDTSKWTSFVDSNKAEMAIGSPTLNMWVASWNEKYPSDKIYCNNSNERGYFLGTRSKPTTDYINSNTMSSKAGYKVVEAENMYYPHKNAIEGGDCYGYWLATSGTSIYNSIFDVDSDAGVIGTWIDSPYRAFRPVVALKSRIEFTKNADGTITIGNVPDIRTELIQCSNSKENKSKKYV